MFEVCSSWRWCVRGDCCWPIKQVEDKLDPDQVLEGLLGCPIERMQAQQAYSSRTRPTVSGGSDADFAYGRGDIPIFNFDEADRILIATLQELIEALRSSIHLFAAAVPGVKENRGHI